MRKSSAVSLVVVCEYNKVSEFANCSSRYILDIHFPKYVDVLRPEIPLIEAIVECRLGNHLANVFLVEYVAVEYSGR